MPAYFFQRAIKMTGEEFDFEFKSMREMYKKFEGDPIKRLRELGEEEAKNSPNQLLQSAGRTKRLLPGRMYMFNYRNPISKATANYYDMYPVVLVMNVYQQKDYFQGLNFHYLPPLYRAELMDQLFQYVMNSGTEGDELSTTIRAKLEPRIDYEFMKKRRNLMSFKPLFKRYNMNNVIGQYLYVPPKAWDFIMMMPLARFRKAGINRVYRDSLTDRRKRNQ
tara:strand:+ start:4382 stop:5044 length:663 start_codon:yes stop_codon:yes gene_type:complete